MSVSRGITFFSYTTRRLTGFIFEITCVRDKYCAVGFMLIVRGLLNLKRFMNGCVATIGNFDGVHLGHQAVIKKLSEKGKSLGLPVVIVLFEPQPREYFQGRNAPQRLTCLREKIENLRNLPIDYVVVLRFDSKLAVQEPEAFIESILVEKLNTKYLVLGDDFRFGNKRRGDFRLLCDLSPQYGYEVDDTGSVHVNSCRVSSTLIRKHLLVGDLVSASEMLGRPYSVCGRIIHGEKRGRELGFPTANVRMLRKNTPIHGVFAVTMTDDQGWYKNGVANVGTRPTIDQKESVLVETHLFDFDGDLYGKTVEVHFHKKIRDEVKFATIGALQAQIQNDVREAREFLLSDARLTK